jgi:putative methionine-R-sulfoxide reductase with GAF domain
MLLFVSENGASSSTEEAAMGLREMIASASDPASVMERVTAEALVLIPSAEGAWIQLYTDNAYLLVTAASGNLSDSVGTVLSLENSLSGHAIRSGVTQRTDDATIDPRVDTTLATELGVCSIICVPLRRGDEYVGVLNVTSGKESVFGRADESTLTDLAQFVSNVIGAAVDLATCTTELLGVQEDAKANTVSPDRLRHAGEAAIAQSNFIANVVCPDAAFESVVRGGVFSFGDASFHGSTGNITLAKPITGIAPTPDGDGYWLTAADGCVFSFGDANFYGSAATLSLGGPIVGIAQTQHLA